MIPRTWLACGLVAWGCGAATPDRELFLLAQDPDQPPEAAVAHCQAMAAADEADACMLALADLRDDLGPAPCARLQAEQPKAECWFRQAERWAEAGDRWGALDACGLAGPFMDECLYHAWTRELQGVARSTGDLAQALRAAEEPIAYWSQLETAGPIQPERVWGDFWYFWWLHHPPASLEACGELSPELTPRCERGAKLFVERSVDQVLRDPAQAGTLERCCRSGQLPDFLPGAAATPEPSLQAAGLLALERLCSQGPEAPRPWNPVFQPRRSR